MFLFVVGTIFNSCALFIKGHLSGQIILLGAYLLTMLVIKKFHQVIFHLHVSQSNMAYWKKKKAFQPWLCSLQKPSGTVKEETVGIQSLNFITTDFPK